MEEPESKDKRRVVGWNQEVRKSSGVMLGTTAIK